MNQHDLFAPPVATTTPSPDLNTLKAAVAAVEKKISYSMATHCPKCRHRLDQLDGSWSDRYNGWLCTDCRRT